jgi:hypothetical protein
VRRYNSKVKGAQLKLAATKSKSLAKSIFPQIVKLCPGGNHSFTHAVELRRESGGAGDRRLGQGGRRPERRQYENELQLTS